ncbi:MAG: RNA polymerase factor sigma-54 [Gammaproteobacteria bacterium]|nr:RNA polymerase factor sigma-54 [Gammaproteobacteria bacterium]
MLKHGLQLKLGQQLTMTPALQQAIRLLQLSSLEIRQEVQEALESNLMLEEDRDEYAAAETATENKAETAKESGDTPEPESLPQDISEDSIGDFRWEDVYEGRAKPKSGADDLPPLVERVGDPSSESLQAHLHWQLDLARLSPRDQEIAEFIIDSIDDDGYLHLEPEALAETLNEQLILEGRTDEPNFDTDEAVYVLHRVQQFDPPGIAARTPQECLTLQLAQLADHHDGKALAQVIVDNHLETLAKGDRGTIQRQAQCDASELDEAITLIRSLSAHPGAGWSNQRTEYVIPDVFVYKHNERWLVRLNGEHEIPLRINQQYAELAKDMGDDAQSEMMRSHLQEARWLIKSLQSRNDTLVRVANAIVDRQQAWFDKGDIALTPMVLRDIADELGLHESTISRVTSSKHMHTSSGIVPFKHFFSSHVGTQDGGEASSIAIQAMIKELVSEEPATKPLSDTKLANALAERNIKIARRTIAKYREALGIPPSHERKRLD